MIRVTEEIKELEITDGIIEEREFLRKILKDKIKDSYTHQNNGKFSDEQKNEVSDRMTKVWSEIKAKQLLK